MKRFCKWLSISFLLNEAFMILVVLNESLAEWMRENISQTAIMAHAAIMVVTWIPSWIAFNYAFNPKLTSEQSAQVCDATTDASTPTA